jgi:protein phosphatase 2C
MEDAVSVRPNFVEIGCAYHFYGVFDGHGCCHVAVSCKDHMHDIMSEEMKKIGAEEGKGEEWWKGAMGKSFLKMDAEVSDGEIKPVSPDCPCKVRAQKSDHVGSTAVVSVVGPNHIVVANCGDSRAVLCRDGTAVALSSDHKVTNFQFIKAPTILLQTHFCSDN